MEKFKIKLTTNGHSFIGDKASVARWYCLETGTKLFVIPDEPSKFNPTEQYYSLFADFSSPFDEKRELSFIASFERNDDTSKPFCPDLETAYEFFFDWYLMEDVDGADWKIALISDNKNNTDAINSVEALLKDKKLLKAIREDKDLLLMKNGLYKRFCERVFEIVKQHGYIVEEDSDNA